MISDGISNKKHDPIVNELFTRGFKLNISMVLSTHSVIYSGNKRGKTKNYTLLHHAASKQWKASNNCH